jgi:hypothetical protein
VGIVAITSKDDISALEAKGSTLFKAVRDDYGGALPGFRMTMNRAATSMLLSSTAPSPTPLHHVISR